MIITDTRKSEKTIIEMYYHSIKKEDDDEKRKAKGSIDLIIKCFQLLSKFANENHDKIVEEVYFSRENIQVIGVLKMADKVHMHPNTLYLHRQKYCEIIKLILAFIDENNIFIYDNYG